MDKRLEGWPPEKAGWFWLWAGLFLSALGFVTSWIGGVNLTDESWFLQVVYRLTSGTVLYRDVFFGITPLSIYLAWIPISIFGAEVLVVKALMALSYALTIILATRIGRQIGLNRTEQILLAGAALVYILPVASSPYKAFAQLFYLLCYNTILIWLKNVQSAGYRPYDRKNVVTLFIAGIFSGLCFLCYQTWGIYTLAALCITILVCHNGQSGMDRRPMAAGVLTAGAGFTLISFLLLVPVVISGGLNLFIDYAFLNKTTYASTAGLSYLDGLQNLFGPILGPLPIVLPIRYFPFTAVCYDPACHGLVAISSGAQAHDRLCSAFHGLSFPCSISTGRLVSFYLCTSGASARAGLWLAGSQSTHSRPMDSACGEVLSDLDFGRLRRGDRYRHHAAAAGSFSHFQPAAFPWSPVSHQPV